MTMRMTAARVIRALFYLGIACLGQIANATTCGHLTEAGEGYTVCEVAASDDLRLFLTAPDGKPFGSFRRLADAQSAMGKRLVFAMNAGMYHPDRAPVGLYVENGQQKMRIITSAGPGNFGLLPNGVFCFGDGKLRLIESRHYKAAPPACRFATQSGPMLVIAGALHPKFLPDSDSRHVRNGVGVSANGRTAYFVISDRPVTFYAFASLFRDRLKTPNALYFDGSVSRIYAPMLGRSDPGRPMGPIVGVLSRN